MSLSTAFIILFAASGDRGFPGRGMEGPMGRPGPEGKTRFGSRKLARQ